MPALTKERYLQISMIVLFFLIWTFQLIPQRVFFGGAASGDLTIGWPFPFFEWPLMTGTRTLDVFHLNCFLIDLAIMAVVFVALGVGIAYILYQRTIQIADYFAVMVAISFVFTTYRYADRIETTVWRVMDNAPRASESVVLSTVSLAALALFSYTFTSVAFRVIETRQGDMSG
jgi:hypothetical protein